MNRMHITLLYVNTHSPTHPRILINSETTTYYVTNLNIRLICCINMSIFTL